MSSQGASSLHEAPFTIEVLGDIILVRGEHLLDSDIDPEIRR